MGARPLPPPLPGSLSWERLSADGRAARASQGRSAPSHLSETRAPFSTGICSLLQEASPGCLLFHERQPSLLRTATLRSSSPASSLGVCWLSSWNALSSPGEKKNVLIPQKHNSNASSSKKPSHISLIGLHSQPLPLLSKLLHSLCALRAEAVDLRPGGTPGDSVRRPPLASLPPACVPRGGAVLAPRQPTARADRCLLRCVIYARIS